MRLVFSVFLLCVACLGLLGTQDAFSLKPWETTFPLELPVFAIRTTDGCLNVIDKSQRRVVRIDSDGKLLWTIEGGSRKPNRFFYTQEIAEGPNGHVFLLNQVLDTAGFFLIREEIQEYDANGRFLRTIHQVDLQEKSYRMIQRCWTRSLKWSPDSDTLTWFELDPDGVRAYAYTENSVECLGRLPLPEIQPHLEIADIDWYAQSLDAVVVSLKSGRIILQRFVKENLFENSNEKFSYRFLPKSTEILYDAETSKRPRTNGVPPVAWEIEPTEDGSIVYADMPNREICRLCCDGTIEILYTETADDAPTRLSYRRSTDGYESITTCNESGVVMFDMSLDGKVRTTETDRVSFSTFQYVKRLAVWGFLLLLLFSVCDLLWGIYVHIMRRRIPQTLLQAAGVLFIIGVTLAVTLPMILDNMKQRQQQQVLERLEMMIHTIPLILDADLIERLDKADTFMNEDYRKIREQLNGAFHDHRDSWNTGWYYALYRIYDDRVFGLMFSNDQIGPFNPFVWNPDFRQSMKAGKVFTDIQSDPHGAWIYGIGPIRNSRGEVVAVFETGTDVFAITLENRALIQNVLLDVLSLLIVIVLCMFEFLFFMNTRFLQKLLRNENRTKSRGCSRYSDVIPGQSGQDFDVPAFTVRSGIILPQVDNRKDLDKSSLSANSNDDPTHFSPVFLVRTLVFLFYMAFSFSVAFLPLMIEPYYDPAYGISKEVFLALPNSIQMFCFGLGTLAAGWTISKLGIRTILHFGFFVFGSGLLGVACSRELIPFLISLVGVGFGTGLGFIAIRSFVLLEPNQELKDGSFTHFYSGMIAGIYVGILLGSAIAEKIGYHGVFTVAAGVLAVAWLYAISYTNPLEKSLRLNRSSNSKTIGLVSFLANPIVFAYFLLHILPVYVASSFINYFFPVFAAGQGLGTGNIGRIMILNGLAIIYLGPLFSRFILKRFGGPRTMGFGQIGWGFGIFVFALYPTIIGAAIALVLFGIAEACSVAGENNYYLRLKITQHFGEERAIAVAELVGKLGDTLGPILFALALGLGQTPGLFTLAAACSTVYVLFYLTRE